jgi:hypothetical protein
MLAVGGQVIDGKIQPVALGKPEESTGLIHLDVFVRVERCRSVGEVRGGLWIGGVRNIDHHDTRVRLLRVIFRRHVGAVTIVRRPILRKRSLSAELANELEIAVVTEFRVGMAVHDGAFLRRGLTLQAAFGPVRGAARSLGHGPHRSDLIGSSSVAGRVGRENRIADQ